MSNEHLRDPFNPDSGEFAKNIRTITGLDDTDLKKSLKLNGWFKELPAIVDENDVVLVGHRRMRLAKQLGIEPVIQKIKVGKGDEADAYRFKLAIASNSGNQPMSKDDRKRIAEYLYGQKEWTMEKIAEALDVTAMTVSNDLRGFKADLKPSRPKGGRPKNQPKPPKPVPLKEADPVRGRVAGVDVKAKPDSWKRFNEIAREEKKSATAKITELVEAYVDPEVDVKSLPMSAQEKLAAAIRQAKHKLEADFDQRVRDEIKKRIEEMYLPAHHKVIADAEEVLKTYRKQGIFTSAQFKKIIACLHPDRVRDSELKERYTEAFNIMNAKRLSLVSEAEEPTQSVPGFPKTYAEMMALKAKVSAARKAKRGASTGAVTRR